MPNTIRCPQCRSEQAVIAPQAGAKVVCRNCGLRWLPTGQPLDIPDEAPPATARPVAPARPKPKSRPGDEEPITLEREEPFRKRKPPVRKREARESSGVNPLIWVAVAGLTLALLGGAGVAAWLVFGGKSEPEVAQDKPAPEPAPRDPQPAAITATPGAGSTQPSLPSRLTGPQIYNRLLKSAALVVTERGLGSGVIVHLERRLVVTNYHVIRAADPIIVLFPAFDEKRQLITEMDYYLKQSRRLGVPAKVVYEKPDKDLAVLELGRLPVGTRVVSFAPKPPPTGSEVFSVGAAGIDRNLLWKLASGRVTGRSERQVPAPGGPVSARILETNAGLNPGDSGGPVVNDHAELVAVVSHFDRKQRDVSGNIDVDEVRKMLRELAERDEWTWKDPPPVPLSEDDIDDPVELAARLNDPAAARRLGAARRLAELGPAANPAVPALIRKLDDPELEVRGAVGDALAKAGVPAPSDIGCLEQALRSGGPNARLYALRYYAVSGRKLPQSSLPDVVTALADPTDEARRQAVRALANYGPGCKRAALVPLVDRVADSDPPTAEEAARLIESFAPFDDVDREVLVKCLMHDRPAVRAFAVRLLTPLASDAATALVWFRPRLEDAEPAVRMAAVLGIAKWGPAAREALPDLLSHARDGNPQVAAAAARAVGQVGRGKDVLFALQTVLADPEAPAEVKQAAGESVLAIVPTEPVADIPVLSLVTAAPKAQTRASALTKLAEFGPDARREIDPIKVRLKDSDAAVRVAALNALGAIGPDAAGAIPDVAALLTDQEPESVAVAAAGALGKVGSKSVEPLTTALKANLAEPVQVRICESLGAQKKDSRPAVPALLDGVSRPVLSKVALTALVASRNQKLWEPDPAAAALLKIGGDEAAKGLLDRTQYKAEVSGGVVINKQCKYDSTVQWWAIQVLAHLDPKGLSDDVEKQVADRLEYLSRNDPEAECKAAAKAGLALHPKKR